MLKNLFLLEVRSAEGATEVHKHPTLPTPDHVGHPGRKCEIEKILTGNVSGYQSVLRWHFHLAFPNPALMASGISERYFPDIKSLGKYRPEMPLESVGLGDSTRFKAHITGRRIPPPQQSQVLLKTSGLFGPLALNHEYNNYAGGTCEQCRIRQGQPVAPIYVGGRTLDKL
ncbi:hypothetical protein J6590_039158 [Homalodisca vitripennis]|nr:hypothetical protein J6590_039158 [Homalodisca vitripennis]